jgi:Na+-transporting methylmalonyl-CoA/oxaloacetate decarboxylase beta subunit
VILPPADTMEQLNMLWANTGLQQMVWGQGLMLLVGMLLLYLAIVLLHRVTKS